MKILVVGGGIGGMATALACGQQGHAVQLFEQAAAFGEVGAGVQLGPNAVRILDAWGLSAALREVAAQPQTLRVRDAQTGATLAQLPLGHAFEARYGQPYFSLARADLHGVLLRAVQSQADTTLTCATALTHYTQSEDAIQLTGPSMTVQGDVAIASDGLWSSLRAQMLNDGAPHATGHVAYRALVRQADLPLALRSADVTLWLAPGVHVVHYPVRGGEWLNLVAIVTDAAAGLMPGWEQQASPQWQSAFALSCQELQDRLQAIPAWRCWALYQRPPLSMAHYAQGRLALLGDAAHPMLPYLAQGAAMALEDARALQIALSEKQPVAPALQHYAQMRFKRNAQVQSRSQRNARLFHARGPVRWARDAALRCLGPHLLDQPWLYR